MKTLIRSSLALSLIFAVATLVSAHEPPGVEFFAYGFHIKDVPDIDGDRADWDAVPDIADVSLNQVEGEFWEAVRNPGFDLADYNIQGIIGWNDELNRVYMMVHTFDDILSHGTYRGVSSGFNGDDDINFILDADHSGGNLFDDAWLAEGVTREEQELLFFTTGQLYTMLVPPRDGFYSFMYFLDNGKAISWLTDGTQDVSPDYLETGWSVVGDVGGPGETIYEYKVTPFEILSYEGAAQSTIVDLEPDKIIHVGFVMKDYDDKLTGYEGSYDFPGLHNTWRNASLHGDFVLLEPPADCVTADCGSAVEADTWGRIKASYLLE
jgi:hypothetical protein